MELMYGHISCCLKLLLLHISGMSCLWLTSEIYNISDVMLLDAQLNMRLVLLTGNLVHGTSYIAIIINFGQTIRLDQMNGMETD